MSNTTTDKSRLSLAQYVRYRNGVDIGEKGSMKNMLERSFGAGTFGTFWQYWNPIWGYALGRYVHEPLQRFFPVALSLVLTFIVSGVIHDLATMLVRRAPAFVFTPWFFLMSLLVLIGRGLKIDYSKQAFAVRVIINLVQIIGCFIPALWLSDTVLAL